MLPSQRYQQLHQQAGFKTDVLQTQVVLRLDALYERLVARKPWYTRRKQIQGMYLWGHVGIGKSFLTDLFFDCLPAIGKTRQHYQHFMARVHRELNVMTGIANPLSHIGKKLAAEYDVICLDELYITDLGDAMIVYQLFTSLFEEGVALLITSNFAIEHLYKDDLQPRIFQPAIQLLKAHTEEVHLQSVEDYRRLHQDDHPTWYTGSEQDFATLFDELNLAIHEHSDYSVEPLFIHGHVLKPVRYSDSLGWFSFAELCERPRSAKDYLALGKRFQILLVSGVPQFGGIEAKPNVTIGTEDGIIGGHRRLYSSNENAQRRFISLVDECYDQGFKLHVLCDVPLAELYAGGGLAFEFQRTLSRLTEMQSAVYRDRALRKV
ncbi:MAG: cell division protein ZapE [Pseudomonadota bacterium]